MAIPARKADAHYLIGDKHLPVSRILIVMLNVQIPDFAYMDLENVLAQAPLNMIVTILLILTFAI